MKKITPILIIIIFGCVARKEKCDPNIVTYKTYCTNPPYKVLYVNQRYKWQTEVVTTNYWLKCFTVDYKGTFKARVERIECRDNDSVTIDIDTKYEGMTLRHLRKTDVNTLTVTSRNYTIFNPRK